jgi:hypothetical protein
MPAWTRLLLPRQRAVAAAATVISTVGQDPSRPMGDRLLPSAQEWQNEVWGFYDDLGMYRNAVTWKSDMLSRVRLRAGKKEPGNDEPTILQDGRAAELIDELGPGTQSHIMSSLAVYLGVPGEGYLIGETQANGQDRWQARSADEVRYRPNAESRVGKISAYEVVDEHQNGASLRWRPLSAESLVVRVWRPHKRFFNFADSNSRSARNTMRELELANRHITAQYMSRLASCGMIIFPQEVTFKVRPEFQDAPDPFMREWIEMAAEALKTPGSAAATVPLPMRMAGEYIEKVRYIDFTSKHDLKLIEKRDSAVKQLAVDLDVPPEALLGLSDANHWTGWLIEESAFKVYLAPDTELICEALTRGYLIPRLLAEGEDTTDLVVWYDASEITQRPDKSENTVLAYDRGEASGEALRRELGLDEDDAPDADELARMILYKLAITPQFAVAALKELTGVTIDAPPAPLVQSVPTEAPAASGEPSQQGPPEQQSGPPAGQTPAQEAAALHASLSHQATLPHAIQFDMFGARVFHPADCSLHIQSCPVTHATWGNRLRARPGQNGMYACWLDADGRPIIGQRLFDADVSGMVPGSHSKRAVLSGSPQ